ncbi:MAG: FAD-dependent oxidoreductase [Xanthobacteraceae bacterium]
MAHPVVDRRSATSLETDVLVVGGGAAGVAAACTVARSGLHVTLLERYGFCGGGAVAGLSGTICGLYEASDDAAAAPRQVVHGFVDRFINTMQEKNGLTGPVRYGKTFTRVHDPLIWREAADHLLAEAGVKVLLHTVVTDVLMDGGERVAGVMAYSKQGRIAARAALTIDASGDADVIAMAGLPYFVGEQGRVQNPTMIFRLQGVDVDRFLTTYGPDSIMGGPVSTLIGKLNSGNEYHLPRSKIFLFPTPRPHELLCNATRIVGFDGRELNPLLAEDLSEAEIAGRRQVREYARFLKDHIKGCENSFVNDTGVQVGVRQSRQLRGERILANEDVVAGRKCRTGIARSPWPIELHSGEKPRLSWLLNDYYEVPYECFVPAKGESVLVAGRCLSAQHEAMASARVTAQCFSYGHAIGHAAAIAVKERIAPRAIDGADIRLALNRDGAQLD